MRDIMGFASQCTIANSNIRRYTYIHSFVLAKSIIMIDKNVLCSFKYIQRTTCTYVIRGQLLYFHKNQFFEVIPPIEAAAKPPYMHPACTFMCILHCFDTTMYIIRIQYSVQCFCLYAAVFNAHDRIFLLVNLIALYAHHICCLHPLMQLLWGAVIRVQHGELLYEQNFKQKKTIKCSR